MTIIIPDDYQDAVRHLACFHLLDGLDVQVLRHCPKDLPGLQQALQSADILVLIRERTEISDALLAGLPRLKCISQTGKVSNHIDVAACQRRGITVLEGVGSPVAPAELTWALLMNAVRRLPQAIADMKAGHWQTNIGETVSGKIIGIWGYGKIGQRIAGYAAAFGAKVWVWGSEASRQSAVAHGYAAAVSKADFFARADIVTLHLRLNEATRGIVTAADLAGMKPGAILVNTARAELIEPNALLNGLNLGHPAYAALDVFEEEPVWDTDHPLLQHPRVCCTPHLGYVERNGYELYFGKAFENALNWIKQTNL